MSMLQTEFDTATPPCEYHDGMPCEPCREIAQIAQIENHHSRLKDLRQQHRHARLRRNHIHSPLIHRFPLEIVTDIFTNAFPPRDFVCYYPGRKAGPLILGKVCHTWRQLAFSIPRLWCDLSVDVGEPNLPLLSHQVAHSGIYPLSILLFALSLSSMHPPQAKEAISLVIKQLHRTGSLCLNLPKSVTSLFDSISELDYPKAAPCLKELHIHSDVGHDFRLSVIEPPRPQQVRLELTSLNHNALDWSNITNLKLQYCHVDWVLPTLLASTHLKELRLWLDRAFPDVPTMPTSPVVIPSIEDLILENIDAAKFMFTTTILPSLRTLEATGYELLSLNPLFCDFLGRSLCPLQVLDLGDCDRDGDEDTIIVQTLIDVLTHTNMLLQLDVAISGWPLDLEPLVQRLSQHKGFLPCLQTLSMDTKFVPVELLLNVMEDRHIPGIDDGPDVAQPLQKLVLDCDGLCNISQDNIQRIIRLQAAGKTISITAWPNGTKTDVVEYWKGFYEFEE